MRPSILRVAPLDFWTPTSMSLQFPGLGGKLFFRVDATGVLGASLRRGRQRDLQLHHCAATQAAVAPGDGCPD